MSTHMGVTCGDPSRFTVARCQKVGAATRARTCSLNPAMPAPSAKNRDQTIVAYPHR
jgi:hypothetical protein